MRKNKVCLILILLVSMFVSCQNSTGFLDLKKSNIGDKPEGENAGQSHSSGKDSKSNGEKAVIEVPNNKLTEEDGNKLTEEDINKLTDFVKKSSEYANILSSVYREYISASNNVRTYSGCSKENISTCSSEGPSKIRNEGVDKLNDPELVKEFKKLAGLIKFANSHTLDDAIKSFEEAAKDALALNKAKAEVNVKSVESARKAAESYLKVIDVAIKAYIDALAAVTTSFSEFNTAIGKFAEAAKPLAKERGVAGISTIVYAIGTIILKKDINSAISSAERFKDVTGQTFPDAIKALNDAYRGDTK
ncbi:hypothetical protein [Candidatus Borreliella tachyglossi]|uniref:hypothetical protein n=1 Tax=Candidatus Borreliella tachyglossi TaxID=1964448 RepID=UPI004042EB16